jgi:pimeloyl-ACP methyl ester carboxylesterase
LSAAIQRRRLAGAHALELLACPASDAGGRPALLFVHGAYVGAWCWAEHFLPWFAERGYPAYALSLRGHGGSGGRDRLDAHSLADFTDDLAAAVAELPCEPVLIGHSMGALVVQKFLERAAVRAAAHLCPVPPYGLLPASFALALMRPSLYAELHALASGGRASRAALQEALFAGPVDHERLERHYARMQPESRRALLDMAGWGLPLLWRMHRAETLVLAAERDALIAPSLAASAARLLGASFELLPGLGHAVMLEPQWRLAAEALHAWLQGR